jgi:hypothetical protein
MFVVDVCVLFFFSYIRKEGGEGPCVHSYVFPPDYPKVKAPSDCLGSHPVHRHNMLWLPPEYCLKCVTTHGNIVVLGFLSGRVAIFEFAF